MSRLPFRGRLKAVAADFCQLINSPSTREDNVCPPCHDSSFTPPRIRTSAFQCSMRHPFWGGIVGPHLHRQASRFMARG